MWVSIRIAAGLLKPEVWFSRSGAGLRIFISSKFPGDAGAAGSRTALWEPLTSVMIRLGRYISQGLMCRRELSSIEKLYTLNWCFANLNRHTNHRGTLARGRFCFIRLEVGSWFLQKMHRWWLHCWSIDHTLTNKAEGSAHEPYTSDFYLKKKNVKAVPYLFQSIPSFLLSASSLLFR